VFAIVQVKPLVVVSDPSDTVAATEYVPALDSVGVPDTNPVAALIVTPGAGPSRRMSPACRPGRCRPACSETAALSTPAWFAGCVRTGERFTFVTTHANVWLEVSSDPSATRHRDRIASGAGVRERSGDQSRVEVDS
jgi:hypothetical protein